MAITSDSVYLPVPVGDSVEIQSFGYYVDKDLYALEGSKCCGLLLRRVGWGFEYWPRRARKPIKYTCIKICKP